MNIKDLQKICHSIAIEKGFWSEICPKCKGTGESENILKRCKCLLCTACNICNGCGKVYKNRNNAEMIALIHSELSEALEGLRKNDWKNVGEELADCTIRILDFCEGGGIDLEKELLKKIEYNKIREYKHGKEF